jgi:hypothetical protein
MQGFVCRKNAGGGPIAEGFGKNMIAIIIVHYHKVIITVARGGDKSSSLVRVNLSGRLDSSDITVVGFGGRAGRVPIGCLVFGCALVRGTRAVLAWSSADFCGFGPCGPSPWLSNVVDYVAGGCGVIDLGNW